MILSFLNLGDIGDMCHFNGIWGTRDPGPEILLSGPRYCTQVTLILTQTVTAPKHVSPISVDVRGEEVTISQFRH